MNAEFSAQNSKNDFVDDWIETSSRADLNSKHVQQNWEEMNENSRHFFRIKRRAVDRVTVLLLTTTNDKTV